MPKKMKQKKLLLAVDGSDRSLETVKYVGKYTPFRSMKVVLFHVFSDVPDCYWDMEREPKSVKAVRHVRAWINERKKEMDAYMDKARQILLRNGFPSENIEIKIRPRKKGVARDIVREAEDGYRAVVLRRRGETILKQIILGSVAIKLMERLSFIPILIVGRKPMTRRVLIAVDGSEGADRAIDFAAEILAGHGFGFHLVNVIRKSDASGRGRTDDPATVCPEVAESGIADVLAGGKKRLVQAGFPSDSITTRVITEAPSRAGALAEEADRENCETIVVGRRGLSKVREFFIGRVSNKIVTVARKNTVWVVT
jgi:nucleotide-binding universal stress UspA family protein